MRGEWSGLKTIQLYPCLEVDSVPITKVHLSPGAELLTAYSPTKRTLVVWELTTGKLKSAYTARSCVCPFSSHTRTTAAAAL